MKLKSLLNTERIVALFCMGMSAWIFYEASTFKGSALDSIGPALYPRLVATVIGICGLALLITAKNKPAKVSDDKSKEKESDYKSLLVVICALIIYSILIEWIGFIICTVLFLFSLALYLDKRPMKEKIKTAALFSIGLSICLYLFFGEFLGVLLPEIGLLG